MDAIDLAPLPIGQRLRLLRIYAGDSVQAVADRWDKHQSYVYRVERGELEPSRLEIRDVYERAERVSEQIADADASANPPASNAPDDADLDDARLAVSEAAGQRHQAKGVSLPRRSRGSKS